MILSMIDPLQIDYVIHPDMSVRPEESVLNDLWR